MVRLVIRNIYKSVKVSFWAEQISCFQNAKFKKRDPIILEDIRKKKNTFFDFTHESSIIRLDDCNEIKVMFDHLLPKH